MKLNFKVLLVLLLLVACFNNTWAQHQYLRANLNYSALHSAFIQRFTDVDQVPVVPKVYTDNNTFNSSGNELTTSISNSFHGSDNYVSASELFYPFTNVIDRTALHNVPDIRYMTKTVHFSGSAHKTSNTPIIALGADEAFLLGNETFDKRGTSAPEPETYAIVLTGVVLLGFAAKRRRTYYH